jgi:hypothetical protein
MRVKKTYNPASLDRLFVFFEFLVFFGLLYPDQVIEDRHEVLLNAPALLW